MSKLLRGGRVGSVRKDVVEFTSSIKSDQKLFEAVIKINQAHVTMLIEQKIIGNEIGGKLLSALSEIDPKSQLDQSIEDVHLAVEEEINKRVGPKIGGNLHIAKSRNDQVATAIRMTLRVELLNIFKILMKLQNALLTLAKDHTESLIPSYTHLNPAQPISFSHMLLSYVTALQRSQNRLVETFSRVNMCPMGAGAIATTSFPIDRNRTAKLLGFGKVLENSIDAVGSRDFILETMSDLTLLAIDISRIVEDLLIWSSPDFGIIDLPEDFTFTSSIMPQKKNPDVLEVIRAKMSQILGNFVASAATMKALPSGYNLDLQELTPKLWESLESIGSSINILSELIIELKVRKDVFGKQILQYTTTTELANMLVKKYCIPFRTSHKLVGAVVKLLLEKNLGLSDLTPELLDDVAKTLTKTPLKVKLIDIKESINAKNVVNNHKIIGGPAPTEVKRMLKGHKLVLKKLKSTINEYKADLEKAKNQLQSAVESC